MAMLRVLTRRQYSCLEHMWNHPKDVRSASIHLPHLLALSTRYPGLLT